MTNYIEFSAKIKEKYPQYADIDDKLLAEKMIEKYPQYADQVTFEEKPEPKKAGLFDKVDIREYFKDELAKRKEWEENHPIISNIQKDFQPGYRAAEKEMELRSKYGYNAPVGEELKTTLNKIGQEFIPAVNTAVAIGTGGIGAGAKGLGAQIGKSALQGSVQGGVLGLTHDLGDNGIGKQNITELLKGLAFGGAIGGALPVGFAGGEKALNLIPMAGGYIGKTLGRLQPETLERVVNPNSKALDLGSKADVMSFATDLTNRVRDTYNKILKARGEAKGAAAEKLNEVSDRINIQDILNDIKNTFNQYQKDKVNPARYHTGNLEKELNELVESGTVPLEQVEANISKSVKPQTYLKDKENEAFDILSKATGKSVNWLKSQLNSNKFKGGIGKRKEFIDNLISNLDDKLEVLKSGDQNGYKYYYDANLGYGNRDMTDVNAVENLVRQAYDDIVNRNFTNEVLDPLSREIAGAEQSYRYLLRNFIENSRNPQAFNIAEQKFNNIVKNLPAEVQEDFANKFINDIDKILQERNTLSASSLQGIKETIGKMSNWKDTTRNDFQNTIPEQIYGKMRGRLEDLSPELAQANKDFASVKSMQEKEGLKRILQPGDKVDSATSALDNFDASYNKGNTFKNVKDLEDLFIREGYEPFVDDIHDIVAAKDLNNIRTTGDSFWASVGTTAAKPLLKLARKYNTSSIPNKVYNLKTAIKGLAVPLMYRPQLQGNVEYNDYDE